MLLRSFAQETYMQHEFSCINSIDVKTVLMELNQLKTRGLVYDITLIGSESVFAIIRCDVLDTLLYRLQEHGIDLKREIVTTCNDNIRIEVAL